MTVNFGLLLLPDSVTAAAGLAQLAEKNGFTLLGIGDSQSLFCDVYVTLAMCAAKTKKMKLGPTVTNPLTRHPVVTASAMSSIDQIAGGRAILGIGTGDSAIYNIGRKAASTQELKEAALVIRQLFDGNPVNYKGSQVLLKWAGRRIPIYLAAEGPQMQKMAGQLADGVILGNGLQPEIISSSLENVRIGAEQAGRKIEDLDIWFFAKCNLDDDRENAIDSIKMALAASANHAFRFSLNGKDIPQELSSKVDELKLRYVYHQHEQLGPSANAKLIDELGLTDYLVDRFAIAGTAEDCLRKVEMLEKAGASNLLVSAIVPNKELFISRFSTAVVSRFV